MNIPSYNKEKNKQKYAWLWEESYFYPFTFIVKDKVWCGFEVVFIFKLSVDTLNIFVWVGTHVYEKHVVEIQDRFMILGLVSEMN